MPRNSTSNPPDREDQIQKALLALKNNAFPSVRAAARHFDVDHSILVRRRRAGLSHTQAHEIQQILTNAEESILVRWVQRYTITGAPLTNSLLRDLAYQLRCARVTHASRNHIPSAEVRPINDKWLYRFKNRHPKIQTVFARQLEHARFEGATYERVERWFNAVASQFEEYKYDLSNVWNMDESGFGIGEEQAMKVLIHLDSVQKHKVVAGKQEWVTDIESISAAGESLPPLLIFKGKNMNTRWISDQTPNSWYFATSQNGWTSNNLGLHWLRTIFDPLTYEKAGGRRRLLIADGHGSHIQADFIAHCIEHDIDLLIMPPHCSHILQPLDVGVFAAFKRSHTSETHAISRLSSQRLPRAEWIELLARAREKAVTKKNILAGWRGAGLSPAMPMRVLRNLPREATLIASKPRTPPETSDLDLSLLKSSPPEPVELLTANKKFTETLRDNPAVLSPVKRYADRMTRLCESQNSTIAIQAKQLAEQSQLLYKRNKRSRGKRVKLDGIFVYTTEEVLQVAREAEVKRTTKRPRGRPRKVVVVESADEDEAEDPENTSSSSDEEPAPCRRYVTRSRA